MLFRKSLHINESLRPSLAKIRISEFQDFVHYLDGQLTSRPYKRRVRTFYLGVDRQRSKYSLKQTFAQSFNITLKSWYRLKTSHSATASELLLLELFRDQGILVMNPVAWGERMVLG